MDVEKGLRPDPSAIIARCARLAPVSAPAAAAACQAGPCPYGCQCCAIGDAAPAAAARAACNACLIIHTAHLLL